MAIKEKLVIIYTKGSIPLLGGISGPILNPIKLDISLINKLINARYRVYEVNPSNKNDKVLLTMRNLKLENFPAPKTTTTTKKPTSTTTTTTTNTTNTTTDKNTSKPTTPTSDFTKKK